MPSTSPPDIVPVGRVAALWRYPVKSMAGERLDAAALGWHGVGGDRRWAFVRDDVPRSGFPWLTIRERPAMCGYRPRLTDPAQPDGCDVLVRTPDGTELDVIDPALAAQLAPGARPIKQDRGVFDTMPISLISTATVAALGELIGRELDVRRFRPNVIVEADAGAFAEDDWVGHELVIGDAVMRVDRRDRRCVLVNVDPDSGERDPSILRAIAQARETYLGVYGTPVALGAIAVGDAVLLRPATRSSSAGPEHAG